MCKTPFKNFQDNLNKMDEKLEAIRREIPSIDSGDFAAMVEAKFQLEAKVNELLERAQILTNELDETKKVKNPILELFGKLVQSVIFTGY